MPSHRRRIHRSRRNKKPILIAGLLIAIAAVAAIVVYSTSNAQYTLTIYTVGQGSVVPSNSTYSNGARVDLKAVSASNWTFYSWSGDVSSSDNTSITMNGNKAVTAIFIQDNNTVKLTTNMGNIIIQLRDDMPITTGNFKNLTEHGIYDNTTFHRVVSGFMIQGGDPTGTGYGDPSIPSIQDEFTSNNKNERGTIAMANRGSDYPNSGSSQFFINLEYNSKLDTLHPVFGRVVAGMNVVDAIAHVEVVADPISGETSRPAEDVTIIKAEVLG
jgi:peptidylprolyl isomerase